MSDSDAPSTPRSELRPAEALAVVKVSPEGRTRTRTKTNWSGRPSESKEPAAAGKDPDCSSRTESGGDDDDEREWFLEDSFANTRDPPLVRSIEVDHELGSKLKPYQREGVEFLWRNCFSDFNYFEHGDESRIGGCILAHFMGLGKSFTTLATLHTALACPSMVSTRAETGKTNRNNGKHKKKKPLLHTVLLIAPANTLTNWKDEALKWTEDLSSPLEITNLGAVTAGSRPREIKAWKKKGGILVLSDSMFIREGKKIIREEQPDVLVLDEAHTMLKQSGNKGFKCLLDIRTKRRILLTGTPLQNNVTEFYRMMEYIRPGVIGTESTKAFEKTYR